MGPGLPRVGAGGACCRCAHARRASPLACAAVCALVLAYTALGALLFLALEGDAAGASAGEHTPVAASQGAAGAELRARTVERLWAITEDLNILYKENWTALAARELIDFQRVLVQALRAPTAHPAPALPAHRAHHADDDARWTFATSFLYALTLITTIGEGGVSPASCWGRLASLAYASVGIPLVMVYLATLGDALARLVRRLYARLRPAPRPVLHPPDKLAPPHCTTPFQAALNLASVVGAGAGAGGGAHWSCGAHARVPAALGVAVAAGYVALGALVFRATERWSLLDGCYFSFSSLATIGFGALRPGRAARGVSSRAEDAAVAVCCAYILVGIAVVAMCFNLVQDDTGAAVRALAALCGGRGGGARAVHSAGPGAAGAGAAGEDKVSLALVS